MEVGYCESEYEAAMLDLLVSLGWTQSGGDELHRKYSDALILDDLRSFLQRRYPDFTPEELERIVFNLSNSGAATDYLALRATASLCVNGFVFSRDDLSLPNQHVDYIDFENPQANIFRAVNQLTIRELGAERRPDILLFVNGIPLCIIELKNPAQRQASIFNAWEQIHVRYRRDIPSLMKFCMLSAISDGGSTRLGTTYAPFEHYYAWKKVQNEEDAATGLGEMQTLVKGAFAPERFLEIVRDFVYFPDVQEGQQRETEIVCRYPQFFAVKKLYDSDLCFAIGCLPFETAHLFPVLEKRKDIRLVNHSEGIPLLSGTCSHAHHAGNHSHAGTDPHIWLSPKIAARMAATVFHTLAGQYPAEEETFRHNYNALAREIDSIAMLADKALADKQGHTFLIYHPALTYFAADYGLRQISIEEDGKEPNPAHLRGIIDLAREEGIRLVFIQNQFDINNAQAVAREIGGEAIAIDPLAENWTQEMTRLIDILKAKL